jgi:dTDP-glucose 4,6-dehydratase
MVEGIYRLLLSDAHLPVNIGNPSEISMLELAQVINTLVGNKAGTVFEDDRRGEGDPQQRKPDITRAQEILQWEPNISLEEGLKRTITYFKQALRIE